MSKIPIPIACTLTSDELVDRRGEWKRMIERASARELHDEGAVLTFPREASLAAELADLVAREVECCAFFTFTVTVSHDAIVLRVTAPADARGLVDAFASLS